MLQRCLLALVLSGCCFQQLFQLSSATPSASTTTAAATKYNCSHSYTLRIGNSSTRLQPLSDDSITATGACTEKNTSRTAARQCVLSSKDGYRQCSSLSEILSKFSSIIGGDDCLQLELEEGEYAISSLTAISVNYSLVMMAAGGLSGSDVAVSCFQTQVNYNCTVAGPLTVPLMFNKSDEEDESVVVLDGVKFQGCPRPFQFDNIDQVVIRNCWFR